MNKPARVVPPPTAFRVTRTKAPRREDGKHLACIRRMPCCVCGTHKTIEAAHIRMACRYLGKLAVGMQEKPDDSWVLPLCAEHHRTLPNSQHSLGEAEFWKAHGIDPFVLALALWRATGRDEEMESIIGETRVRAIGNGRARP